MAVLYEIKRNPLRLFHNLSESLILRGCWILIQIRLMAVLYENAVQSIDSNSPLWVIDTAHQDTKAIRYFALPGVKKRRLFEDILDRSSFCFSPARQNTRRLSSGCIYHPQGAALCHYHFHDLSESLILWADLGLNPDPPHGGYIQVSHPTFNN